MVKTLAILGSTGSIGRQALDVCKRLGISVCGLSAGSNIDLLERQIEEFRPRAVCVADVDQAFLLSKRTGPGCEVIAGADGLGDIASMPDAGAVLNALVGVAGLRPTMAAIEAGKDIALANKETLVTAGELVTRRAREKQVGVYPVDSEHSAIFQCLRGNAGNKVRTIYLTASGGPFREKTKDELKRVTLDEALRHPNWAMGPKITVDCATLMNKGLEVIEAKWLFDLRLDQINVLLHPQSVIHSMVEYADGAVIAQLGVPDMRLPIQYALTWPERPNADFPRLDFLRCPPLTFGQPDIERFPCLRLAFDAAECGGLMPAVMNGADEEAVSAFLNGRIPFTQISALIEHAMGSYRYTEKKELTVTDVMEADEWARDRVQRYLRG